MMRPWLGWTIALAAMGTGCPASDDAGDDGGGSTSAGSTGTGFVSVGSTTDPPPADCASAMTQEACDAMPLGGSGRPQCAWVEVFDVVDAGTCELASAGSECIAMHYQGEGCLVPPTCGDPDGGLPGIYHRGTDPVQLMAGGFCETQPEGWAGCQWPEVYATSTGGSGSGGSTGGGTGTEAEPPTPPECACLCP